MNDTQREEIRDKFYKECGQYCNDAFEEVADWWFPILDEQLDKKVEEERSKLKEELKEKMIRHNFETTHICGFNEGECKCGKFLITREDILDLINKI